MPLNYTMSGQHTSTTFEYIAFAGGRRSSQTSHQEAFNINPAPKEACSAPQEQAFKRNSFSMPPKIDGRPLHACPGLPKPNQEMKYFTWNNAGNGGRCSSGVNLSKMTHCDHSERQQAPASTAAARKSPVSDEEMNAVIALSSCFKNNNGDLPNASIRQSHAF